MTTALVALGSNIGHRQSALRQALERLAEVPGTHVQAVALFRQTQPVGCPPDMPAFVNSAAKIETSLGADEFLEHLLRIERELGRHRSQPAVPEARTIDLDLILFGDSVISLPHLIIPHPRMQERLFVLEPLADIAPDYRHPILGKTMMELLREAKTRPDREGVAR